MNDDARDIETAEIDSATSESDDSANEFLEESAESDSPAPTRRLRRDLWRVQVTLKPIPVILILLVLITAGTTAWLYVKQYQPDQQTNPSVENAVLRAASEGTVALLSYAPDTLDEDFATARSHLAGDFLAYYNQFTEQYVAPAAKEKALRTSAEVVRAAVSELKPDSAVVLVFVNQRTMNKDHPEPSVAASSVLVTMSRIDGTWMISKFIPI
ncbi:hypothetical protein [Mycobacterium sp.]|uniref:hypothetical protein n=1 Tax=Mycobacterium sp. TaxID=1785 RepID=UPI003BAC1DA0